MNKYLNILIIIFVCLLFLGCNTTENREVDINLQNRLTVAPEISSTPNMTSDLYLQGALKNAVVDINERISQNYILAIVNFDTSSTDLSNYLIDELTSIFLRETNIRIVERGNLEIIQDELNFQMSGAVSDETAKSIGKFIGADSIVTGTFFIIGNKYRLGVKCIHVETGIVQSLYITNVIIDRELLSIINSTNANQNNTLILPTHQTENLNSSRNFYTSGDFRNYSDSHATISPDGKWIISKNNARINIYDIINGNLLRSFPAQGGTLGNIGSLTISNDGRIIAISYFDPRPSTSTGVIELYDVLTGRKINNIKISGNYVTVLCQFNPVRNQIIAIIGNSLYLFDLINIENNKSIQLSGGRINSISYSFDGSYIAIGKEDGTIEILASDSLIILKTLIGHSLAVNSLSFNSDNSILISGSSDFSIGIWDLSSGREILTLTEHFSKVESVLFIPNGNYFLSSSSDGVVKLWNAYNYQVLRIYDTIASFRQNINYYRHSIISLSPDGNYFITDDGVLLFKIE